MLQLHVAAAHQHASEVCYNPHNRILKDLEDLASPCLWRESFCIAVSSSTVNLVLSSSSSNVVPLPSCSLLRSLRGKLVGEIQPPRKKDTPTGINMMNFFFGRTVGLTGGLSSGKSTVSNLFRAHGIPVVDADLITGAQLNWGTGGFREVVAAFGQEILQENGQIDRPRLGQIVSCDPDRRRLLYGLLAPYIKTAVRREMWKLRGEGHRLIVIDAPMLFEVKMEWMADTNVVVWVDPETQIRRLMARDGISEQDATNRINAQMPLDAKRNLAHTVIDNTGSLDALNEQFQSVLLEVSRPVTWTELIRACLVASIFFALGIVILLCEALISIALAIVLWKDTNP